MSVALSNFANYIKYGSHYRELAGSYSQDVEGYNDDLINEALEEVLDAY